MVYRNIRNALVIGLVVLPHLTAPTVANAEEMIGDIMAKIMIEGGCVMTGADIYAELEKIEPEGTPGVYQAEATSLGRGGMLELVSTHVGENGEVFTYRLCGCVGQQ